MKKKSKRECIGVRKIIKHFISHNSRELNPGSINLIIELNIEAEKREDEIVPPRTDCSRLS
jgi:hypothetical protein